MTFQTKVSQAMEDRMISFPEPNHIEGTIYSGGFPSFRDKELMLDFHSSDDCEEAHKNLKKFLKMKDSDCLLSE